MIGIGIACAVGASVGFTVNDTAVKLLSGGYALHQVVLIRALIACTLITLVVMPLFGGWHHLRSRHLGQHAVRGGLLVFANMCFFLSLSVMPIAEATAIYFAGPLIVALFSVMFLGERVGPRRWAAIAVGLVGVMVIIRPGSEVFAPVALLPLLAATGYAGMNIMTRRMRVTESALTLAFYVQIMFISVSTMFGLALGHGQFDPGDGGALSFLTRGWVWPALGDWAIFGLAGVASTMGGLLIAQAYRACEAALVAPLEYAALPLAILSGLLVFGDRPDALAWAGMALILGAGLFMAWRETRAA